MPTLNPCLYSLILGIQSWHQDSKLRFPLIICLIHVCLQLPLKCSCTPSPRLLITKNMVFGHAWHRFSWRCTLSGHVPCGILYHSLLVLEHNLHTVFIVCIVSSYQFGWRMHILMVHGFNFSYASWSINSLTKIKFILCAYFASWKFLIVPSYWNDETVRWHDRVTGDWYDIK